MKRGEKPSTTQTTNTCLQKSLWVHTMLADSALIFATAHQEWLFFVLAVCGCTKLVFSNYTISSMTQPFVHYVPFCSEVCS